jgi:hypothetical protein
MFALVFVFVLVVLVLVFVLSCLIFKLPFPFPSLHQMNEDVYLIAQITNAGLEESRWALRKAHDVEESVNLLLALPPLRER